MKQHNGSRAKMINISLQKKIAYIGGIGVVGIISTEFGVVGVLRKLPLTII